MQQASLLREGGGARQVRGGRGPAAAAKAMAKAAPAKKHARRRSAPPARALRRRTAAQGGPARASARLARRALAGAEEVDAPWSLGDGGAPPRGARPQASAKEWEAALKGRCDSSVARGRIYDSEVGISCHFCRQKKLCGEPDCPRCSRRDPRARCAGKSECSRCGGGRGAAAANADARLLLAGASPPHARSPPTPPAPPCASPPSAREVTAPPRGSWAGQHLGRRQKSPVG